MGRGLVGLGALRDRPGDRRDATEDRPRRQTFRARLRSRCPVGRGLPQRDGAEGCCGVGPRHRFRAGGKRPGLARVRERRSVGCEPPRLDRLEDRPGRSCGPPHHRGPRLSVGAARGRRLRVGDKRPAARGVAARSTPGRRGVDRRRGRPADLPDRRRRQAVAGCRRARCRPSGRHVRDRHRRDIPDSRSGVQRPHRAARVHGPGVRHAGHVRAHRRHRRPAPRARSGAGAAGGDRRRANLRVPDTSRDPILRRRRREAVGKVRGEHSCASAAGVRCRRATAAPPRPARSGSRRSGGGGA